MTEQEDAMQQAINRGTGGIPWTKYIPPVSAVAHFKEELKALMANTKAVPWGRRGVPFQRNPYATQPSFPDFSPTIFRRLNDG